MVVTASGRNKYYLFSVALILNVMNELDLVARCCQERIPIDSCCQSHPVLGVTVTTFAALTKMRTLSSLKSIVTMEPIQQEVSDCRFAATHN